VLVVLEQVLVELVLVDPSLTGVGAGAVPTGPTGEMAASMSPASA
jgi:hypothetical protein